MPTGEMETPIVDGLDELTAEWFTGAMREGGSLREGTSVSSARSELYGTGQFGLVIRSELAYEGDRGAAPDSVFVKLPSEDEGSRRLADVIGAYEAEVRFYREIAPRVKTALPHCHWADFESGTSRVTIVIEDLTEGWTVGDAVAGGTVAHAGAALDQLVALQAPLWDEPGLRDLAWLSDPQRRQALFEIIQPALPPFMERFGGLVDPKHLALAERLAPKAAEYPAKAWQGPLVVTHGDYRLDNLLFSDAQSTATVIDWQSVLLAPPLIDAGIFLGTCLEPDVRREHQDELLRRFHEGLLAGGVQDFSFDDCRESFRVCSLYVFLLGIGASMMLQQSERGDQMFAALVSRTAELVEDVGAADYLD